MHIDAAVLLLVALPAPHLLCLLMALPVPRPQAAPRAAAPRRSLRSASCAESWRWTASPGCGRARCRASCARPSSPPRSARLTTVRQKGGGGAAGARLARRALATGVCTGCSRCATGLTRGAPEKVQQSHYIFVTS
eukprot:363247-Chlamydomonas_euryale.AAC.4